MDRYDPELAARSMRECVDQGIDHRVCACAVEQARYDRRSPSTPSVDAGPPALETSVQVASAMPDERLVAMCTRSARALGLLEN